MTTYDQRGQTVYGDQYNVAGDLVVHGTLNMTMPIPLSPEEKQERGDLGILLNKVRSAWIEGFLEKSIHNEALLDLGKEVDTEAVEHPWERVVEMPGQETQTLPLGQTIAATFAAMERAMLILGEPGAGKTITLLELARELIAQVEAGGDFSQPVPVVFNLSSWNKGQSLLDWLVAELSNKYQIPKRIGRVWLEKHRLLPLLDGLDEVRADDRADCVEAINAFGEEYGLAGLAVCSRLAEYTALPIRLKLNGAIRLQPLTPAQVDDYLTRMGSAVDTLRETLQEDKPLRELAQSPLMLNIMSLAYQDGAVQPEQPLETVEARRDHLFDTYLHKMFTRKGKRKKPYTDEQTTGWLTWLARGMRQHDQSIFLIEQLQPSWIERHKWCWLYVLGTRFLIGLLAGLGLGLLGGLMGGLMGGLSVGLSVGLISVLIFGPGFGLSAGLGDGLQFDRKRKQKLITDILVIGLPGGLLFGLISGLITGLLLELLLGLSGELFFGLSVGLFLGLFPGLAFGLAFGLSGVLGPRLRSSQQSLTSNVQTVKALYWSWQKALKNMIYGMIYGLVGGLITGLTTSLFLGLSEGLYLGLKSVLFFGLTFGLFGALFGGLDSSLVENKTTPNQGINLSLKNALFTGLIGGLLIGSIVGLRRRRRRSLTSDIKTVEVLHWSWQKALKEMVSGLILGLSVGLYIGLMGTLFGGLSEGLYIGRIFLPIFGLTFGLFGALFGGLDSSLVENKTTPNQGINLSLENALFTGLIGGSFIGLLFGLFFGLFLGLVGGLSGGLLIGMWGGGSVIIQHYTLRLILWHRGYTPRNYVHFLDYAADRVFLRKVGGGYIFIHRLLLEHFAEMNGRLEDWQDGKLSHLG